MPYPLGSSSDEVFVGGTAAVYAASICISLFEVNENTCQNLNNNN